MFKAISVLLSVFMLAVLIAVPMSAFAEEAQDEKIQAFADKYGSLPANTD